MIGRAVLAAVAILAALISLAGCGPPPASPRPFAPSTVSAPFALRTVAAYVVPWDARSLAAIPALGTGTLTEASPVWYQPAESGQLVFASPEAAQSVAAITAQASSRRLALVPSVSNYHDGIWDGALIHHLIADPRARAAHIAALVALVQSHAWAGIDIDYESLAAADRAAYSAFIRDLAAALHQAGKRLTLTVHAKTAEPGDWSGARAQDWRALGASADEVRVMAYDYVTEASPPGPIAPVTWVARVLRLAVAEVPRDKIVLGLATYGYDWPTGQPAQDVQWADARTIAQAHRARVSWDPASQSPWFAYTSAQGHPHTVWYEDARSLQAKLDLATQLRLGGIVLWRLGGEDPAIWPLIRHAA